MRAVLLRRMMVLGVCALGVCALYLVPGITGPSQRIAVPAPAGEAPQAGSRPASDTASVAARTAAQPAPGPSAGADEDAPREDEPSSPAVTDAAGTDAAGTDPAGTDPAGTDAGSSTADRESELSAADRRGQDTTPPEPVSRLAVRSADAEQVEIGWAPSSDDSGTVRYRVWFNGYELEPTSDNRTTLTWFNVESPQQVVVVRAVDAAGNQSRIAATLLLTRPDPGAESGSAARSGAPTPAPSTTDPTTGEQVDGQNDGQTDGQTDASVPDDSDHDQLNGDQDGSGAEADTDVEPTPRPSPGLTPGADRTR
jgi:hypothetical protein